jgi:hypothetical protein
MSVPLQDTAEALAVRKLDEYEPPGAAARARAPMVELVAEPSMPELPQAPRRADLHRLLCLLLEVLDGRRPPNQLRDRLGDGAYASMLATARRTGSRGGNRRPERLHISRPAPEAIELCATVTDGRRCRATAARVELHGGQWLCTNFYLL